MSGWLHSRDEPFSFGKNYRLVRVRPREFLHGIHGLEAKQRYEFHFVASFANEQFCVAVTGDLSRGDAGKNLIAQQFFVCVRVCRFRPSMPNACDHIKSRSTTARMVTY